MSSLIGRMSSWLSLKFQASFELFLLDRQNGNFGPIWKCWIEGEIMIKLKRWGGKNDKVSENQDMFYNCIDP